MLTAVFLPLAETEPTAHPYGWLSLLPPLVAVGMAVATKRVFVSLLTGLAVGALLLAGGNPIVAAAQLCETHLFLSLIDPGKLRLITFTLFIGATVGVVSSSGGMRSLVELISPLARDRRSGQFTVWASGLIVFFDDYANTLLLGSTFRSTCDRLRISRQKLAYLVDSTAAPVAGLAIISTWIAVEIDYINEGLIAASLNEQVTAFELFLNCIPYRFYVIQALLLVVLVAITGRDFGPMRRAEQRALAGHTDGAVDTQIDQPMASSHWMFAVLPIAVTLIVSVWLMLSTGWQEPTDEVPLGSLYWLRDTFGNADSYVALQYGGLLGFLFTVVLCRGFGKLPGEQLWNSSFAGVKAVLPAVIILWLAGALSRMTGNTSLEGAESQAFEFASYRLYTGDYLKELLLSLGNNPDALEWLRRLLPTLVFLLAGFVAFSTGTSFGTMGILLPMIIPFTSGIIEADAVAGQPLMLASVGSVMAGAIFGDHCSPISDTTILSSQASGCDHVEHVNTQLPYAMLGAGVSILLGTLLVGFGVNVWLLLVLQMVALIAFLLIVAKPVDDTSEGAGEL